MPIFNGTPGPDSYTGTSDADTINGFGGDDQLQGGDGNDLIDGGDGNDWIDAGSGQDTVLGGAGDDTFHMSSVSSGYPDSSYDGQGGYDTLDYSVAASYLVFNSTQSVPTAFTVADNYVLNVERIISGSGDDIFGFAYLSAPMEAHGGQGNDQFFDGNAAHDLYGGPGNDSFYSSGPGDRDYGEEGDDNFFVSGSFGTPASAGVIDGGPGFDTVKLNILFDVDLQAGTATSGSASYAFTSIEAIQVAAHYG